MDILASQNGKRIAYEVETGTSDISANIRKCLDAGFDQIVVAFTSDKARERFARNSAVPRSVHLATTTELYQSTL